MAKIGVYVCWCGTNIANMVDVVKIADEIGKLPNVAVSRDYKYMCSDPGQDLIIKDIKDNNLDRIVVASCSPRMHELTFRKALEKAGLNPYMLEMANIREHVSWVHEDKGLATNKAWDLIVASVARVNYHEALAKRFVQIHPATVVIGGGVAGMAAALEIADAGKKVFLVEKTSVLGGNAAGLDLTFPDFHSSQALVKSLATRIISHANIELFPNSEIRTISGYVGNFEGVVVTQGGKETEVTFGNIVLATGLKSFDPSVISSYGYGVLPNVITSIEFEAMMKDGRIQLKDGKIPGNVAIIHCVGSRNKKYHEYCSRVCCTSALKFANQLRGELPDANIFEIYADMRTFGKGCEELYSDTSKRNIKFLMFDQEADLPLIEAARPKEACEMWVKMNEKLSGKRIAVPADLVILMVAMESRDTAKDVSHKAGISMDGNGFYIEKHPKLDPVATTTNGVFIAGCCSGPKDIPESIVQAKATVARILATIARGSVEVEVTTAFVNGATCAGCKLCTTVCAYSAISFDLIKNVAHVNEVLCKGCGTCAALCRSKSIDISGYTHTQMVAQINAVLAEEY